MKWTSTLIKVFGSISPFTAPLVQLQSELESDALQGRLERLEDPLGHLHEDIPALSQLLYSQLQTSGEARFKFDDATYHRFRRSLAVLEAHGYIECARRIGSTLPLSIWISDPAYLIYLSARFEEPRKMEALVSTVDSCAPGQWLDGKVIASDLKLPVPVVKGCFDLYEAKGFGLCSREIGRVSYSARN